jgi:hypothetical protein
MYINIMWYYYWKFWYYFYIDISGGFKVVVWSKLYDLVFVPLIYIKLDIHLN